MIYCFCWSLNKSFCNLRVNVISIKIYWYILRIYNLKEGFGKLVMCLFVDIILWGGLCFLRGCFCFFCGFFVYDWDNLMEGYEKY